MSLFDVFKKKEVVKEPVNEAKPEIIDTAKIARYFGAQMAVLDEGASLVAMRLDEFFEANGIDPTSIELPVSAMKVDKMLANDQTQTPQISFVRIPAIPLTKA